ncbi:MAG: hypothetical protein RLZZ04_3722 [Cyanobacteriota bacterium]|jgi:hypothetical protein
MNMNQIIRCPNCGSQAERRYFTSNEAIYNSCPNHQVLQTECPVCDYLMVMCSRNASVIEAHAPSTSVFQCVERNQILTGNEPKIYPQKSLASFILDLAI